jgi:hypothetical protein
MEPQKPRVYEECCNELPVAHMQALSDEDKLARESLKYKQDHLRTAVLSLADGHDTGLFVYGDGAIGKSFLTQRALEELKTPYVHHNSRLTGRGLAGQLAKASSIIHWIEDAEPLLSDRDAVGILRSACWSQSDDRPMQRPVKWTTHTSELSFVFTGGLLMLSNRPLPDKNPEIRALKSRIRVLHLTVSHAETVALMKTLCGDVYIYGDRAMTADECWAVATFIQEKAASLQRPLDLRLLKHGFRDFLLHRAREGMPWQETLAARMEEAPPQYKGRRLAALEEADLARQIHRNTGLTFDEKVSAWHEKTGKSQSAYDRALKR